VDAMTKREWAWAQRDMLSLLLITLVAGAAFLWGKINSGWIAMAVGSAGAVLTLAGIMLVVLAAHLRHLQDRSAETADTYFDRLRAQQMPQIEIVDAEIVDDYPIYSWTARRTPDGRWMALPFAEDGTMMPDRGHPELFEDSMRAWEIVNEKRREIGWIR
jgi:hypothetical protein